MIKNEIKKYGPSNQEILETWSFLEGGRKKSEKPCDGESENWTHESSENRTHEMRFRLLTWLKGWNVRLPWSKMIWDRHRVMT